MKRYRLRDKFYINDCGDLVLDVSHNDEQPEYGITAYCRQTLEKFPNILKEWFEEVPEQPKTVWDLKDGDECWTRSSYQSMLGYTEPVLPRCDTWRNDDVRLRSLREIGGVFLSKEECERSMARDRAEQILLRDTKGFKPDWENYRELKWKVTYDYLTRRLLPFQFDRHDGTIRFASQEDAEASIKNHPNEWKAYLGVEE